MHVLIFRREIEENFDRVWKETEQWCMRYGALKLKIYIIFRNLISYYLNFQLRCEIYGLQITHYIKLIP